MKAHIVGAGLSGLAAAAFLVRDGRVLGGNVTVYDAAATPGGAMTAGGGPETGYVLPTGRVFEREFRCAFDLFAMVPSASDPSRSIAEEILAFNERHGYDCVARLLDGKGRVVREAHFGLSVRHRLDLVKLALTPERLLEDRRIDEFFDESFFRTEFWYLWTSLMNALPQSGALEMRRFLHRFLHMLPDMSNMRRILRTRFDQYEAIVLPLRHWLGALGVRFRQATAVVDVAFAGGTSDLSVNALHLSRGGSETVVEVAPGDVVLVTAGSQVDRMTVGTNETPPPAPHGEAAPLWRRMARGRPAFGDPEVFFGEAAVARTRWMTFTATTRDPAFFERMEGLTAREPGRGGLLTLRETPWLLTIALFHQPEFVDQPSDVMVWWGYALYPDRPGTVSGRPMTACGGAEILRETLHHLGFSDIAERVLATTVAVPCLIPHANGVWMPRKAGDRPAAVPEGARNLGFIGQFCEVPDEAAFTMEYAVRSAWSAVHRLRDTGRPPPPVYDGFRDPAALAEALGVLA